MPSADAIVTRSGPISVPLEYTVPATEEIVPLTMRAHFDGTSAAGAFLPALQIVSQNGAIVATATTADSVAAGASADVTWFPGFLEAAASAGGGIQFDTDNVGDWLDIKTTGTDAAGIGQHYVDTGGGGVQFDTLGYGSNGGGFYINTDDTTQPAGTDVVLQVQGTATAGVSMRGLQLDANTQSASTGAALGAAVNAEANAASGATGISAAGLVLSGSGSGPAVGVIADGNVGGGVAPTGDAIGLKANGVNAGTGLAIGADIVGEGATSGTGDTIAARLTAKADAGFAGTLYGLQVFIGTTKVFQINANGSLHGLTGQALTFDL